MSGLRINTNVAGLSATRNLTNTVNRLNKSIERLSSGLRINSAADDAAGFGISERLRTQINGLGQAQRNAQDGVSLIQTAEGGLSQISEITQRLRTLAVQAANDTNTTSDRLLIQLEFNALVDEIDRQSSATSFNTKKLLTGDFSGTTGNASLVFHVGADNGQTLSVTIATVSSQGLGVDGLKVAGATTASTGGLLTQAGAESAITLIQAAVDEVSQLRGQLGAVQNRLENAVNFIGISRENQTAAESRIRDLDFASEIVDFTRSQILQQTGVSALAQSNVNPQIVLGLLQ